MSDENKNPLHGSDLPLMDGPGHQGSRCCGGLSRGWLALFMLMTLVSISTAMYFVGRSHAPQGALDLSVLPLIDASSAVTSEKYSIATGQVSEDADGLFVLDHNSGLLQCSVVYPRMGRFMGQFTVNVAEALGTGGKGGSYLLITGRADFPRASNNPVGSVIVYVMDTATGNYASYYVPFNRQAVPAGRPQQDTLKLITTGTANPVIDRDALR